MEEERKKSGEGRAERKEACITEGGEEGCDLKAEGRRLS